jgi:nicotinamide-nucleotide amidase
MEQIEGLFQRRGFRMSENNRKQAYTPEGAIPIQNPKGTAPGFIVEGSDWVIISLPGVPLEMEYLMGNGVIPYLRKRFNLQQRVIKYEVLRACGLGESSLGLKIKDLMKEGQNPSVGTLASIGDIKIRITAKAADQEKASMMIKKVEQEIRDRLGILIYGMGNETLHGNVVKELERLSLTLSVVETITAGIISQKLGSTNSHSFVQGVLLPLNLSQMRFLNMGEEEFNALTQDQKKLSELSAIKAREKSKSDLGLGVFGKITEDQGKGEYRIETFHSLSTPNGTESQQHTVAGEPWMARERASIIALDMLRRHLLKIRQIL